MKTSQTRDFLCVYVYVYVYNRFFAPVLVRYCFFERRFYPQIPAEGQNPSAAFCRDGNARSFRSAECRSIKTSPGGAAGSGRPGCFYHASGDVIQSFWSSFFQKACGSRAEPSSLSAESETPPAFQKRGKRGLGGRNPEGGCVPHSPIFCTAECKTQIQTHIFNSLIHPLPHLRIGQFIFGYEKTALIAQSGLVIRVYRPFQIFRLSNQRFSGILFLVPLLTLRQFPVV